MEALISIGAIPIGITPVRSQDTLAQFTITSASALFTTWDRFTIGHTLTGKINTRMLQAGIPLRAIGALRCAAARNTASSLHTEHHIPRTFRIGLAAGRSTRTLG